MIGQLPQFLEVNGQQYAIRSDYRDVLKILCAFSDPELEDGEKVFVCLYVLYEDFEDMPKEDHEAALKAALAFIDNGASEDSKKSPRIMDWEQDANLLFPAINKVAGCEVRSCEYVHWWTFVGYYMEITDGVFSNILSLRMKKAKGKKLEKWEQEFWNANKAACVLATKLTAEEQAEKDRLNALLG